MTPNYRSGAAILLWLSMGPAMAGVYLDASAAAAETEAQQALDDAYARAGYSAQIRHLRRTQSGMGNRQELHVGGNGANVRVDSLIQEQTGVGNHQSMSLGAITDR